MLFNTDTPVGVDGGAFFPTHTVIQEERKSSCCVTEMMLKLFAMPEVPAWSIVGQKHYPKTLLVSNSQSKAVWKRGKKIRTEAVWPPLSLVLGVWDIYCICSFLHFLYTCRQALVPARSAAFLGCLSRFFSSYFFHSPPPISPVVTSTFHPPTSPHSTPHPLSSGFLPPHPRHSAVMKAGSNRRSICIYITHVMCSKPLWVGWTAWYQHDTLEITWLSTQAFILRLISYETRVE